MTELKKTRGRPKSFDKNEAIDKAMHVFWQFGYEGASLADLIAAMGINKPSMYSTFGNKEDLFKLALERYTTQAVGYIQEVIKHPTAKAVVADFLTRSVKILTSIDNPNGCLVIQGALTTSDNALSVKQLLIEHRKHYEGLLAERFQQSINNDDLPATIDPAVLAKYITSLHQGLSVQASSGASESELLAVVDFIMQAYPFVAR
jgi:AcrR family transcriptional regulator